MSADNPRDCVTELQLQGGILQLIAWDADGAPGPTMALPEAEVMDSDAIYLLERCRTIYRQSHRLTLVRT